MNLSTTNKRSQHAGKYSSTVAARSEYRRGRADAMERPSRVNVLIAGGGVAALEATLALRELAEERVAITLIAPDADFTYRPLAVAEPFRVGDVRRFPLRSLVEAAGAEFFRGRVTSVDPDRYVVGTDDGDELSYDVLLLALAPQACSSSRDFFGLRFCGREILVQPAHRPTVLPVGSILLRCSSATTDPRTWRRSSSSGNRRTSPSPAAADSFSNRRSAC